MQSQEDVKSQAEDRSILVAVDHSLISKQGFDWAITHLCRSGDMLHLVHVLPKVYGEHYSSTSEFSPLALMHSTSSLMETLILQAHEVAKVKTEVRIISGEEVGKAIVEEAKRINPIAVVLGRRRQGIVKSVLHGSISEYCSHHCTCPVILVPVRAEEPQ